MVHTFQHAAKGIELLTLRTAHYIHTLMKLQNAHKNILQHDLTHTENNHKKLLEKCPPLWSELGFLGIPYTHTVQYHTCKTRSMFYRKVNFTTKSVSNSSLHRCIFIFAGSRSVFCLVLSFSLLLFTHIFAYILFSSTCIVSISIQIGYRNNYVIYPCTLCIYSLCNKSLKKKIHISVPIMCKL
jgi:hypothetical protein